MSRNKSKSPNNILKYKPNQFPAARFGNIAWEPVKQANTTEVNTHASETTDSETTGTTTEAESARIEYLRNRFKSGPSS
jgi:hypothetical protein